jgi:SnoaL-like polyketide cyclase
MTPRDIAGIVRVVIEEIWNQGTLDLADEFFAHDYVNHGGLIPDLILGPEAIKFSVTLYRLAFPSLQIAVEDLTTHEETVTLRWTARGASANDGAPDDAAETHRTLVGVTLSRFAGDHIAESWTYWDVGAEGRRLLLTPPSADPHEGASSFAA